MFPFISLGMFTLWVVLLIISVSWASSAGFVPPSHPDYADLDAMNGTSIDKDPQFIKSCQLSAGYYIDSNKNPSLNKTILMAGINYSYRDFFHNFKCFMDRIGVKFLPVSLDGDVYNYITSHKISPTYLMPDLPGRDKVRTQASGFGGKPFNLIGCRKLEAVSGALKLGYDVIFSDVDIAVVRDPIDFLFFPGVDYVHSENNGCMGKWAFSSKMEGNTGYYSVKSNPRTIRTWELAFKACSKAPLYDDQTMFWLILRTNLNPAPEPLAKCPPPKGGKYISHSGDGSNIVTCPLDNCMFSASNLREGMYEKLVKALRMRKQRAVMAHANWMNGRDKKKAALSRTGLWIAQKTRPNGEVVKAAAGARGPGGRGKQQPGGGSSAVVEVDGEGTVTCKEPTSTLLKMGQGPGPGGGRFPAG